MPFIKMDVAISAENGPSPALMNFRGRMSMFTIKMPNGGIQAERKMETICIDSLHTYCIQALHNTVRNMDIPGRRIHPSSENSRSIKDGNVKISPNVINVNITA